jgi:hypothetical protein
MYAKQTKYTSQSARNAQISFNTLFRSAPGSANVVPISAHQRAQQAV